MWRCPLPDRHAVTHLTPAGAGGIDIGPPFNKHENDFTIARHLLHALPGCQPVKGKADIGPVRRLRGQIVYFTGSALWFSNKISHIVSGPSTFQITVQRCLEIGSRHVFGKRAMHKAGLAFRSKAIQRWIGIKIGGEWISFGSSSNDG